MIASVRGVVRQLNPDSAVVEVGGLGIAVQCAPATLAHLRVGQAAAVATSLVVREDSLTLFGFADDDERATFELLLTASGVGPKLAQAMLAVHSPDELRRAVAGEDLLALCAVPGIGKKGAQRIVLELKDRIGPPAPRSPGGSLPAAGPADSWRETVRAGLLGLGWSTREAEAAIAEVAPLATDQADRGVPLDVAALLRAALSTLARV
ncbi:MAG TPA: Holliday junction branch migration protein RuvA [Nocardioidaceae bacterium]|nr:Holliday junction branch migration protein RuvA [Nocardioidaceae bacterium]